ncbi:hypothetical protein ABGB19_23380 [Mycobacterium sp. B14F4]
MVSQLQFVAIAVFLIWGLASSLCDVLPPGRDEAHLVSRERGPLRPRD